MRAGEHPASIAAVERLCSCRKVGPRGDRHRDPDSMCGDSPLGPRVYRCPRCRMHVPWCFGAADGHPELCDACWDVVTRLVLAEHEDA
jgi:hypothetical protein